MHRPHRGRDHRVRDLGASVLPGDGGRQPREQRGAKLAHGSDYDGQRHRHQRLERRQRPELRLGPHAESSRCHGPVGLGRLLRGARGMNRPFSSPEIVCWKSMHAEWGNCQTLSACSSFLEEVPLSSLVGYLASSTSTASVTRTTASATSTQVVTYFPSPAPVGSESRSQFPVEVILGVGFGGLSVLGLLAGILVWRAHKERASLAQEEY